MINRPFSSYQHSAFISYATADDYDWNSFVSFFTRELNASLASRVRVADLTVPKAHLSGLDPVVSGSLSEELYKNIDASFAMFLFVHDRYLGSEWCLKELKHFKSLLGENGFRERLYVIAMSKNAITKLMEREQWKDLCPFTDQVWVQFFRDDDPENPMQIYAINTRTQCSFAVNPFWDEFVKVREKLAKKIRNTVEKERSVPSYPQLAVERAIPLPEDELLVRLYIEGNKDKEKYWQSLNQQVGSSWEQVVATLPVEPVLYFRPTGIEMSEIIERPMLDDADGVVLVWGKKTPDSLAAQIRKVEPKLSGPHCAPGVIAYLMEGPNELPGAMSVGNWNIVRFEARPDGSARILEEDAAALKTFLKNVLVRKRSRLHVNAR